MKLVLYGVAVSAFVAKVRIALDLKGLAFEERTPPGGYGSAEYRAIVPAGSVPGLTADGAPLHESNALLEFLEEIAPAPALLPEGALERARVRALLGFHDQRVEAATRALFPVIKRDWRAERETVEAACAAIEAALMRLDELDAPAPLLAGAAPSFADIAYPCTMQMARMMGEEVERPVAVPPRVAEWVEAVSALPAVARSLEIHRAAMEAWMAGFRRP
ncbi:MAG: glutathione S-transferase [Pseudomonadota bacterium]|nr:glutathione S-transferase [Pseudomonadota bacterium]MEE3100531.1 glutathione S-transferase [Pseudomonadota bacterium]